MLSPRGPQGPGLCPLQHLFSWAGMQGWLLMETGGPGGPCPGLLCLFYLRLFSVSLIFRLAYLGEQVSSKMAIPLTVLQASVQRLVYFC